MGENYWSVLYSYATFFLDLFSNGLELDGQECSNKYLDCIFLLQIKHAYVIPVQKRGVSRLHILFILGP